MNQQKNTIWFWCFVAPVLIALILVIGIPFFIGFSYSFTNWKAVGNSDFLGLKNYINVFTDKVFISSLGFTFVFAIVSVIIINIIGLSLAMLVTQKLKLANFFRTVYFMPNLIGGIILGFIWQFIFLDVFPKFGLNGWLADQNTGFWGMAILMTWQMSGYIMVIYVAYLQNVPQEVIEASNVDGVSPWQKFRYVIFPLIAPGFTVSIFMTLSNALKLYDQNLSLTSGGPAKSTEMVAMNIYNTAFYDRNMGYAQSKAILFLIIIVSVSLVQTYFNKKREVEL